LKGRLKVQGPLDSIVLVRIPRRPCAVAHVAGTALPLLLFVGVVVPRAVDAALQADAEGLYGPAPLPHTAVVDLHLTEPAVAKRPAVGLADDFSGWRVLVT